MPDISTRPIQVFLDTQRLIQSPTPKTRGPHRDFYAGDNAGFARHKARMKAQLAEASRAIAAEGPAGFLLVQMREEGLGKSYRPLNALFTATNGFALVGGGGIGEMYFQATPSKLDRLQTIIEDRAEVEPVLKEDPDTGRMVERVSAYRSELGAVAGFYVPKAADRLGFSAQTGIAWMQQENVVGGYVVELFRPDVKVTPEAVLTMTERFRQRLAGLPGVIAVAFDRSPEAPVPAALSIDLREEGVSFVELSRLDDPDAESTRLPEPLSRVQRDFRPDRHQALLSLLAREPLVRRIELPLRLERASAGIGIALGSPAAIRPPVPNESYPIVGVVDAGVCRSPQLDPWRAGEAGFLPPVDRDEEHGTFIAGLLSGAGALNPALASHLEPIPSKFFDIDLLPRNGMMGHYFSDPDDFFGQLEEQIIVAKREANVRVYNISLGARGMRRGIGYSSVAAHLDRIALRHDVIFVVSAGNLRGLENRPEWAADPEQALEMLATRAIAEERLTAPGEHLYGLTIGAINPPAVPGTHPFVPTAYTRRGPGPGGARKPELAHIGGASARGGNDTGLYSIGLDGRLVANSGTSFATPLAASTVAAIDHQLGGTAARETIIALAVHRAAKSDVLKARQLRAVARDFVGFGVPTHAGAALLDEPHSITLVFTDVLPPRRELAFDFSWPRSLTSPLGKCRGHVSVTLAHTPPIDEAFDAECQRVHLQAALHQLEEKPRPDGAMKLDPVQRLDHHDTELREDAELTERLLLSNGVKWTPIKRYEKNMPRGCGTTSEWRLSLKSQSRAGAVFPAEGVPFCILMTISDIRGEAPVYEEVRNEILRRGLRLADVTVAQRVRGRGV